jgi:hypothetical protein
MRIGMFLLGGLVGAAAAIYLSDKKNRTMLVNAMSSQAGPLGNMLSQTTSKATNAVMNAMGMGAGKANGAAAGMNGANVSKSTTGTAEKTGTASMAGTAGKAAPAASGQNGTAQVAKMVNEDPELKRTVNEIMADNGKSGAQLQQ